MRGAHIGPYGNVHSDETTGTRERCAQCECQCGCRAQRRDHRNDDEENGADGCDGAVLTGQVGCGTLLNGVCNLLHPGIACGQPEDPTPLNETVGNCGESAKC